MRETTRRRTARISMVAIVILVIAVVSCTEDDGLIQPNFGTTDVVMVNHASNGLPIHILGPQEDFDPSNRVEPGENRQTNVRRDLRDTPGETEFRAGRNGNVLETSVCQMGFTNNIVTWIDGRLECSGDAENVGS